MTDPASTPSDREVGTRSVAEQSVDYMLGSIVAFVGGVLMVPVYTHALTPKDYGLLETTLRFVSVCISIAFMGIRQAYARLHFDNPSPEWRRTLTSTTVITNAGIASVVIFPLLAMASLIGRTVGVTELTLANSALLTIWLASEATFLIGLTSLQVRLRSRLFVMVQSGRVGLLLGLNYLLLHVAHMGLTGALVGNVVASGLSGSLTALILLSASGLHVSRPTLKSMLAFGLPYIPTAAFFYVITNSDRFAIIYFGASASLGLLSLASKIGEMALTIIGAPIESVWSPFAFAVCRDADGPARIGRLYTRYVAMTVFLAISVSLAAPLAVRLLAASAYEDAARLVPIVALGWVFGVAGSLSDVGILIAKRTELKPVIMAAGAVIAIALQALLTPRAGVVGAAVATTLTSMALFVLIRLVAARFYRTVTSPATFLAIVAAGGAAYFVATVVALVVPTLYGAVASTVVGAGLFAVAMNFLGVITLGDVLDFAEGVGLGRVVLLLRGPRLSDPQ